MVIIKPEELPTTNCYATVPVVSCKHTFGLPTLVQVFTGTTHKLLVLLNQRGDNIPVVLWPHHHRDQQLLILLS